MRALRIIGYVLALWAFAALLYTESGVRTWFRTPSPQLALRNSKQERMPALIAVAGVAALGCLAVASLLDWRKRRLAAEAAKLAGETVPATDGPLPRTPAQPPDRH